MLVTRPGRSAVSRRLAGLALATLVALTVFAAPASGAERYRSDTASRRDFVAQTNFVQCVGASMQMMLNMIEPGRDRTAKTQLRLQRLARSLSPPRRDGSIRRGASVRGWVKVLRREVHQPYRLVGADTLQDAMRIAARAIERTDAPVGLLVWRGRHAWVMSGFEATKPLADGGRVTAAVIYDPLYPYGSGVWGPSPRPGEAISLRELGRQFVPRRMRAGSDSLGGKYVLVLPFERSAQARRPR
ncbi:MAG TPA: hypothetical protein VLA44_02495 [Clostridia bacterium]|nr:hypothetical protein [Clostridia bacterium]